MRIPGRRLDPDQTLRRTIRLSRLAAGALLAGIVVGGDALAREVVVKGTAEKGFTRIELRFDEPTKVQVRSSGAVMVLAFGEPARIKEERLALEVGSAIGAVRRDPDGTGLRLALVAPARTNVIEAGERVFVDLLPPKWVGLPPGPPPEVLAQLAERARLAEARAKEDEARRAASRLPVKLRLAEIPGLTRLVFEPAPGTRMHAREEGAGVELVFEEVRGLDLLGDRPRSAPGIAGFTHATEAGRLTVRVGAAKEFKARAFLEDGSLIVDVASAARPAPGTLAGPPPPEPRGRAPAPDPRPSESIPSEQPGPAAHPVTTVGEPGPRSLSGAPASSLPASVTPERPDPPKRSAPGRIEVTTERGEGRNAIRFGFPAASPAAAFQRAGTVTLVFDSLDRLDLADAGATLKGVATLDEVRQGDGLVVLRLGVPAEAVLRLGPEGTAWRLAIDDPGALPADEIRVGRGTDGDGRGQVVAELAQPGGVHWLDDPNGGRLAVVTARGRPSGIANGRRFADFDLLATLQGVAILARADDMSVALAEAGVVISRKAGLTLSSAAPSGTAGRGASLLIDRDTWLGDQAGNVLERYRELLSAAAMAPRSGQAEARVRLARFALANGLTAEASGLLSLAAQEDPVAGRRRETVLLSGIASVRLGRLAEARLALSQEQLDTDPEAILWRARLDVEERRWTQARNGFRRSAEVLERYPDDLAGELRLAALEAALELGEQGAAEAAMAAIDRMPAGSLARESQDLARARVDELAGRQIPALKAYRRLADQATRPVSAEAEHRATRLASRMGQIGPEAAIEALQLLGVAWRGDEIELGTVAELTRFYAAVARWRDMFAATRYANRLFPKHDLTRAIHDETVRRFESLMLGEAGFNASAVDVLALYYDYREYAPVGRRGDEIVRRMADRLVELDLLDQAAELLQYQVDKRLAGAARATVAARLATIRILAGKPLLALAALQSTRGGELPASARRLRLLLEAQANADLTRVDLALEVLEGEEGPDVARLRASILFGARRWREAGEASEALLGTRWREPTALTDRDRRDVIRAAIADVLAKDGLALQRLRSKFASKMADSPDARTFESLFAPDAVASRDFRDLVGQAGRADQFRQLLGDWNLQPSDEPSPKPGADAKPAQPPRAG